jgi:Cft2 family RNA processing exonuclease
MRVGNTLSITDATPVEQQTPSNLQADADNSIQLTATTVQSKLEVAGSQTAGRRLLNDPKPPTSAALERLCMETGVSGWKLCSPQARAYGWEWSALLPSTGQRARVQLDGLTHAVRVYQYPISATKEHNLVDTERLKITPLGAAKGIGASCFRVDIGPYEIVLDCGTRPKGSDPLPALEYLSNPDLLLISHAHQDHIGGVPVFHKQWPGVRMICTHGTREIAHVMLTDCLKVQQKNEDFPPLFDDADLERTLFRLETEPVGQDFEPLPGLKVRFISAGHIVGAACIYLRYGARALVYTGDYNTASSRTTDGLRLSELPRADMLITESTYGADVHPPRKAQETELLKAIADVVQAGGNVLIPAFALGRAQEILLALRTSALFQKCTAPIYVDGLVRAVTDTFREHLELLPDGVQNLVLRCAKEPFYDEKFQPIVIPISIATERPLALAKPSVIIASSGMLTGGPSTYYAKALLEREKAAIFISGYTDEESPGRLLQNLQTGDTIELDGYVLTVRAQIKRFNLSAHADKVGLTQVINKVNPKHLILIHGSLCALHELARSSDLQSKHYIHIPSVGEGIEYGSAPDALNHKQIARIEAPPEFEVEVAAEVEGAWLRIPASVVDSDPRWQLLAGNGVLKAKWSGINLHLCPVSGQQLAIEQARASTSDCCAKCQHFNLKTSRCNSPESPLSELVVDPSGYCLEYTADYLNLTNGSATTDSFSQKVEDFDYADAAQAQMSEVEELNDADEASAEMEKLD